MACNADFVQYIVDQCSGAGVITVRKMMGDYCIYCNGVLFGLICDNNFYVKVTEAGEAVLEEVDLRQPYEGAKDYFFVSNVDNRDYLEDIVKATLPELLSPKAKSRKQARNRSGLFTGPAGLLPAASGPGFPLQGGVPGLAAPESRPHVPGCRGGI